MHKAFIAKIDSITPIPNADRVQTAVVLGTPVVVGKDAKVGDIGVFFPSELELSHDYCRENNLYRNSDLNKNSNKKGFFEETRRVRAQKFLKQKSDGYFAELSSLKYTGYNIDSLKLGDQFDELNGVRVCQKYISKQTRNFIENQHKQKKKITVVTAPSFKEHAETEQLMYFIDTILPGSLCTIEHKWHGTSHRVAYVPVVRLRFLFRSILNIGHLITSRLKRSNKINVLISRLLVNAQLLLEQAIGTKFESLFFKKQYEHIAGSRRVALFEDDVQKKGFHGPETWRFDILNKFKPYLEKGMTIYMEVVGFVNGKPIMAVHDVKKLQDDKFLQKYGPEMVYKYGCLPDQYRIKVYRISMTNEDGFTVDFSHDAMVTWCEQRDIPVARPLVDRFIYDGDKEKLIKLVTDLAERENTLCEDYVDPSHVNEGVVLRVDTKNTTPIFYKYKSFPFKVMEGIAKEKTVDMEDAS